MWRPPKLKLLLFVCILCASSQGQLEIGFSAQLPKDVRVEGSKQADLHGWTWTQKPGFFQYGTDVTSNDIIEAPLTGVYFISANLLIKSMHKNLLKACFGEAACNTYDHPLKSISLVFLVRFQKGDKLSLNILSQKTIIVESGSSFSFQFLGTQSSAPGFSFVLDKNNRVDGLTQDIVHISKEWKAQDNEDTTLFNSLEGWNSTTGFRVPCSGIYLMSASVILRGDKGWFKLSWISTKTGRILSHHSLYLGAGTKTLTLFGAFSLQSKERLELTVTSNTTYDFHLLRGSRYAMVYLGKSFASIPELSVRLNEARFPGIPEWQSLRDFLPQRTRMPEFRDYENILIYAQDKLLTRQYGMYFFSLHIVVEMLDGDEIICMISKGRGLSQLLNKQEGLSTVLSTSTDGGSTIKETNSSVSLLLVGLLEMRNEQFASIFFKSKGGKAFRILKGSWFSMTAARHQTFVAGFTLEKQNIKLASKLKSQVKVLSPWKAIPDMPFSLNFFANVKAGIFKAPLRGIYFVTANLMVSSISPSFQTLDLLINTKHKHYSDNSGFSSVETIKTASTITQSLTTLNFAGAITMSEDDQIFLLIKCNGSVFIDKKSTIFISFMDFIETQRTSIATIPQPFELNLQSSDSDHTVDNWVSLFQNSWIPNENSRSYRPIPVSGIFQIACHIQLKIKSKELADFPVTLFVHFSDTNVDLGFQDSYYFSPKLNKTQEFSLNANGLLKAVKGQKIRTSLKIESSSAVAELLSGRLSLTLIQNGGRSKPIDGFRTLRLSQKLFSFTSANWETAGQQSFQSGNGMFKSGDVEFDGPSYLFTKPQVAYVSTSVILDQAKGRFDYGLQVLPRSEQETDGWVVSSEFRKEATVSLKWSGYVYLEPGQSLGIGIKGTGTTGLVPSNRCSWSFAAVALPVANPYGKVTRVRTKMEDSSPKTLNCIAPQDGLYMLERKKSSTDATFQNIYLSQVENGQNLCNLTNSTAQLSSWLSLGKSVPFRSFILDKQIALISNKFYSMNSIFSIFDIRQIFNNINHRVNGCSIALFSFHFDISSDADTEVTVNIAHLNRIDSITKLSSTTLKPGANKSLEFKGPVCLTANDKLGISTESVLGKHSFKVLATSAVSLVFLEYDDNIEGFSGIQQVNQKLQLKSKNFMRLDGWLSNISTGFDNTNGYKSPYGGFFVHSQGKYLATVNIALKSNGMDSSMVDVGLFVDEREAPTIRTSKRVEENKITEFNLGGILDVQRWQFLHIKIQSQKSSVISIYSGSRFAVLSLDSTPTFSKCPTETLQIRIPATNFSVIKTGENVSISCNTQKGKIADLFWMKQDTVVTYSPGSSSTVLKKTIASVEDSGIYRCIARKGDFTTVSPDYKMIVYDPIPIIIPKNATIDVKENRDPHQHLFEIQVIAYTSDGESSARCEFSVIGGDNHKRFYITPSITATRASLMASVSLDYEVQKSYKLTIKARNLDFAGIAESKNTVHINVLDMNDNPPILKRSVYTVFVSENAPIGKSIYTLSATDKDSVSNSRIVYSLHNNTDAAYFSIGKSSGDIRLRRNLDRESRDVHNLFVIASDSKFQAYMEVIVVVQDVNDVKPYFKETNYEFNVTEATLPGTTIIKVKAIDSDLGNSGKLSYFIGDKQKDSLFTVNDKGVVRTSKSLEDYGGELVLLKVYAVDGGGLKSSNYVSLTIRIMKVFYIRSPKFDQSVYRASIRENIPVGDVVLTLKASFLTGSLQKMKKVRYGFNDSSVKDIFFVSENSGEIYTDTKLDYEKKDKYGFMSRACSWEDPFLCDTAQVEISIEDVNDNSPDFKRYFYNVSLSESTELGGIVFQMKAADKDSGSNGKIRYEIETVNEKVPFAIDQDTGIITLVGHLDYETRDQYVIGIRASDHGDPSLSSKCVLQINVVNVNEHIPLFTKSVYTVDIQEGNRRGAFIIKVQATDKDIKDKLKYAIDCRQNLRCEQCFTISAETGEISANCIFDRENTPSFQFLVYVWDSNKQGLRDSSIVIVNIADTNDHEPVFTRRNYSSNISLSTLPGSQIVKVLAIDKDSGSNGLLSYNLTSYHDILDISNRGVISLKKLLTSQFRNKIITTKVIAYDHGSPRRVSKDEALIKVSIEDSYFAEFPGYEYLHFKVYENATKGQCIGKVHSGAKCCHTEYSITQSDISRYIKLNSTSRKLYVRNGLDFESRSSFTFTVVGISDGDGVYRGLIKVDVIDIEERSIYFLNAPFTFIVSENLEKGKIIGRVLFKQTGYPVMPPLKWTIPSGNSEKSFHITKTGLMILTKTLDYENKRKYTLQIQLCDENDRFVCNSTIVFIDVRDENDNRPHFENTTYFVTVRENATIGSLIKSIKAIDLDSGLNGKLFYSLIETLNPGTFYTTESSGGIYLNRKLDYEARKSYGLYLLAEDSGKHSHMAMTRIVLSVRDVNDNHPRFIESHYKAFIRPSFPLHTKLLTVQAIDPDTGRNGELRYVIEASNAVDDSDGEPDPILIDPYNGVIMLKRRLMRHQNYSVKVSAYDNGRPPKKSNPDAVVTIYAIDDTFDKPLPSLKFKAKPTSLRVGFKISKYFPESLRMSHFRFIAQEYHPNDPEFNYYSQLPILTWYDVMHRSHVNKNYLRRYIAGINTTYLVKTNRIRRDSEQEKVDYDLDFEYGTDIDCEKLWNLDKICNGPLKPGYQYRFQVQISYDNSSDFLTTGFTEPYKTASYVPLILRSTKQLDAEFNKSIIFLVFALVFFAIVCVLLFILYQKRRLKRKKKRGVIHEKLSPQNSEGTGIPFLDNKTESEDSKSGRQWTYGDYEEPYPGSDEEINLKAKQNGITGQRNETESQELTVWFSRETLPTAAASARNSIVLYHPFENESDL